MNKPLFWFFFIGWTLLCLYIGFIIGKPNKVESKKSELDMSDYAIISSSRVKNYEIIDAEIRDMKTNEVGVDVEPGIYSFYALTEKEREEITEMLEWFNTTEFTRKKHISDVEPYCDEKGR